jgi:hypothetical protein
MAGMLPGWKRGREQVFEDKRWTRVFLEQEWNCCAFGCGGSICQNSHNFTPKRVNFTRFAF